MNNKLDTVQFEINVPEYMFPSDLQLAVKETIDNKNIVEKIDFKGYSENRGEGISILIATIPAIGAIIVALLTSILSIAKVIKSKNIILKVKSDESTIIIPAESKKEDIEKFLSLLKKMKKINVNFGEWG